MNEPQQSRTSIILPALDDDESVERLLPQLTDYEVVVDSSLGLGNAVGSGIRRASGNIIVVMDCDGTHPPRLLPYMVMLAQHYDLVCAARVSWGTGLKGIASALGNWLIRHALRIPVKDCTSGFFVGRRERLLELPESIWRGYGDYYFDLLHHAARQNWLIIETPCTYQPRMFGGSHTSVVRHSVMYLRRLLKCLADN